MDISITIVSYNTKNVLEGCIKSLISSLSSGIEYEIFVVDNGSTDGSSKFVKENFPQIHLISNEENVGYTKAMNMGLKKANGDFLVQLNPDTLIQPDTFTKLIYFMRENQDVGICTPKVLNKDGSLQKQCRRSFAHPWDVITYFLGLDRIFPKSKLFGRYLFTFLDEEEVADVDAVSGSCMIIRKDVIDDIGFLDEQFFAYQEDADFCFRAKNEGWRVMYYPKASIIHYGGEGGSKNRPYYSSYIWHNSYYLYYRKNIANQHFFLVNWFMYLAMASKMIVSMVLIFLRKDKYVGTKKPN